MKTHRVSEVECPQARRKFCVQAPVNGIQDLVFISGGVYGDQTISEGGLVVHSGALEPRSGWISPGDPAPS